MPIHQQMDQAMTILLPLSCFFTIETESYCKDKYFYRVQTTIWQRYLPKREVCKHKNTYKRRQISPLGVRKPVFCVEVRPFEATSEYTGCIPWNSYVSDSYDLFAWFLPCWGRGLQGCWKRGVILDFAVQMAAAGHILACRWSQNAPTKLSIYFGQSLLPLVFFELEQSGRRDLVTIQQ